MTTEIPQPSAPNLQPVSRADIFSDLEVLPSTIVENLTHDEPFVLKISETPIIQEKFNQLQKSDHTLRAIVDAGHELFGVVGVGDIDAARKGEPETVVITRFAKDSKNGERAKIVSVVKPGESISIGRTSLSENGHQEIDDRMSREHFSVALTHDGQELAINDDDSTNGTRVLTVSSDHPKDINGVISDFRTWGASSEETSNAISASGAVESLAEQQAILARMQEIRKTLSEDDQLFVWRYASNILNKKDAQKSDDGQGSIIFGQQAGQALTSMSPEARKVADLYLAEMQKLNRLQSKNK